MRFEPHVPALSGASLRLTGFSPLIDGEVPPHEALQVEPGRLAWPLTGPLQGACAVLRIYEAAAGLRLHFALEGLPDGFEVVSLGVRVTMDGGVDRYLRHGYTSWDGSFFVRPGTSDEGAPANALPSRGYAMTALVPATGGGAMILGFTRHDRYQSRLRFAGPAEALQVDIETLRDRVPHDGRVEAEPLALFLHEDIEDGMRAWARIVAAEAPGGARIPRQRITGWCSWYNLYASLDEQVVREHLAAAIAYRDRYQAPLAVFQLDDGFNPEMGDWLSMKPQFPNGLKPLLADIAQAGFTPGLWIAPFMVGNRSQLFRDHPEWVVQDAATGEPLAQMKFYGEFRWHKRSEEYYILDITHPEAEAYIREVFRTWRHDWGCGYFKTDFMLFGSEHGPDRARWRTPGLSRIQIWRKMGELIRQEIGDALWLGCGAPLWASVGLVDGIRISRDVGVTWKGDYSAEGLLRDQLTRNFANGLLWQADPDCILLRDRFHELSDAQVRSLALFAGLSGGLVMTSDKLDELSAPRAELFKALLSEPALACDMLSLARGAATAGQESGVIVQRATRPDGSAVLNLFNMTGRPQTTHWQDIEATLAPYDSAQWAIEPGAGPGRWRPVAES